MKDGIDGSLTCLHEFGDRDVFLPTLVIYCCYKYSLTTTFDLLMFRLWLELLRKPLTRLLPFCRLIYVGT